MVWKKVEDMTHIHRISINNPNNKNIKINIWKKKGRKNICILHTIVVQAKSLYTITDFPTLENGETICTKTRSKLKIEIAIEGSID
jgi:uncharacterized protein involved in tellurium resistance